MLTWRWMLPVLPLVSGSGRLIALPVVNVAVAGTLVLLATVAVVVVVVIRHGGAEPDVQYTACAMIVSAQQSA
jgi:hypothetical protein